MDFHIFCCKNRIYQSKEAGDGQIADNLIQSLEGLQRLTSRADIIHKLKLSYAE